MKKLFPNLLTFFIFSLAFFEIYFYSGFIQKHFFFSFIFYLIFYFLISFCLFKFKKISLSSKLIKLNNFLFLPLLVFYFILIFLEEHTYPNFIYGHLHINQANFIYLPLVSIIVFSIYNNKKFQKIFYFLLPLFATYLSQFVTFGKNFDFQKFSTVKSIVVNYFLWSCLLLISIFPFKKKNNSLILYSSLFIFINIINRYKIKYLNTFFSLNDFKIVKNLKSFLLPIIRENFLNKELIILIILFLLLIVLIKKIFNQNNPPLKKRFLPFILSFLIIITPIYLPDQYNDFINKSPMKLDLSSPLNNCKNSGVLFCFIDDFKNLRFPIPSGYNQTNINNIYSNLDKLDKLDELSTKPNIIVILSEALWDVTKLPQVKYSQDPIKNIRPDIKSTLISPAYGGATANVEFEILTGFSNYFLNNRYPYNQLINQDVPSLFSLFKEQDYLTTVIHPYKKSMYNRPIVYRHFNLDKFISMEDMSSYEIKGSYISDKSFIEEIIKQIESTDQSQFIFSISMQNHMPYESGRFLDKKISLESSLTEKDHSALETYTNGIYLSDQSYQNLKTYLKKSKKPTIVIMYGDHLPYLNNDFSVYKNLEYVPQNQQEWTKDDYQKMYSTPITLWNNFNINLDIASSLSPNFISLEILKFANITPKNQFSFLQSLSASGTVLNKYLTPSFSQNQLKDYELIQYDLVSGKQYAKEINN